MKMTTLCALALTTLALDASAANWGPTWSEVTGNLISKVHKHRTAAIIKQIDGKYETARMVKAEPGRRTVIVQSPMRKGFSGTDVTTELDLEPCKRYYINAQFKSGSGTAWEPVIAHVEKIPGCKLPTGA